MIIIAIKGATVIKAEGTDLALAQDALIEAYDEHLNEAWVCDSNEAYDAAMGAVVEHGPINAMLLAGFHVSMA